VVSRLSRQRLPKRFGDSHEAVGRFEAVGFGRFIPQMSRGHRHSGQSVSVHTQLELRKQFVRARVRPAFSPFQAGHGCSILIGRSHP